MGEKQVKIFELNQLNTYFSGTESKIEIPII